jgi:tetratricopeptide (TPR) repeat protein
MEVVKCGMSNAFRNLSLAIFTLLVCSPTLLAQTPNADLITQYSEAGQSALAQGRYAEAEAAFEKLRDLEPTVAEVHANLGAIYFQERRYDHAIPALRQAIKLKPSLSKAATLLAIAMSETGDYKGAISGLEKGFGRDPDPQVKRMCGLQLLRAYSGLQQDEKAVRTALELNRLYPNDPEILYHTGRIYGNFAYLTMKKLGDVAPDSVWRDEAAGEAYQSQGAYQQAISAYESVLKSNPSQPGIHFRIGRTYQERARSTNSQEDLAAATREFLLELEIDPRNANAAYEIAEIDRQGGDLASAEKYFKMALSDYPDFQEAHVGLGATLISLDRASEALPYLQKGVELNPADEAAWYRLSQANRKLGNKEEQLRALAEYRRLHEKPSVQSDAQELFAGSEVSKQEVEPAAEPQ